MNLNPYEFEDSTKTWKYCLQDPNHSFWPAEDLNNGKKYFSISKLLKYEELENVTVPNHFEGVPVLTIQGNAFRTLEAFDDDYIEDENKRMKTVTISEGIVVLEPRAFERCYALETVNMPDSIEKMGYEVFEHCKSLKRVVFSNSLKEISCSCFQCCSALEELALPPSVQTIAEWAFNACGLKRIYLNEGLKTISDHAFMQCRQMEKIILPRSLQSIDESAFEKSSDNITAYCYSGSYAYFYAKEHGFNIETM